MNNQTYIKTSIVKECGLLNYREFFFFFFIQNFRFLRFKRLPRSDTKQMFYFCCTGSRFWKGVYRDINWQFKFLVRKQKTKIICSPYQFDWEWRKYTRQGQPQPKHTLSKSGNLKKKKYYFYIYFLSYGCFYKYSPHNNNVWNWWILINRLSASTDLCLSNVRNLDSIGFCASLSF